MDDNLQREYDKQRPQHQRKILIEPFGSQSRSHVILTNSLFSEIFLSVLESENVIQNQLNFKYISLQIIRIATSNQYGANLYSIKSKNSNRSTIHFTHLIIYIFHYLTNHSDNPRLVILRKPSTKTQTYGVKNSIIVTMEIFKWYHTFVYSVLFRSTNTCDVTSQ